MSALARVVFRWNRGHDLPRPDFLVPVRGPGPLAWASAITAALVLGVTVMDGWNALERREAAFAGEAASAQALERATAGAAPAPAADRSRSAGAGRQADKALAEAHAKLARPWPAVFGSIEAVSVPGVAWFAFDAAENGTVRLEGSVRDAPSALLVAEQMRASPVWKEVTVGRIANGSRPGELRMELTAIPAQGAGQ